jgi:hypothetical protein
MPSSDTPGSEAPGLVPDWSKEIPSDDQLSIPVRERIAALLRKLLREGK